MNRAAPVAAGQAGSTLVSTLLILFALISLTAASLLATTSDLKISSNYQTSLQALLAAESGILHAQTRINDLGVIDFQSDIVDQWSSVFGTGSVQVQGYPLVSYTVTVASDATDPTQFLQLEAVGRAANDSSRTVSARLQVDSVFSPGAIYLPNDGVEPNFNGNQFLVDGHDTNLDGSANSSGDVPGIATRTQDATNTVTSELSSGQADNVIGLGGTPSVRVANGFTTDQLLNTIVPAILGTPGVVTNERQRHLRHPLVAADHALHRRRQRQREPLRVRHPRRGRRPHHQRQLDVHGADHRQGDDADHHRSGQHDDPRIGVDDRPAPHGRRQREHHLLEPGPRAGECALSDDGAAEAREARPGLVEGIVMRTKIRLFGVLALVLAAPHARADFEITLRDGKTLFARSWWIEKDKIIATRGAGTIELDRGRVVNIRDLGADKAARRPAPPPSSPRTAVRGEAPGVVSVEVEAMQARERELTRALILAHRDLLFAENRGDSPDALAKRKADVDKLEAERGALHAKLAAH
jgi:Tfp pilus assembly protein PilX